MFKNILDLVLRNANSGTVRWVTVFSSIWAVLSQSEFFMDFMSSNPAYMQILAGIQALVLIVQRNKTTEPIKKKPRIFDRTLR